MKPLFSTFFNIFCAAAVFCSCSSGKAATEIKPAPKKTTPVSKPAAPAKPAAPKPPVPVKKDTPEKVETKKGTDDLFFEALFKNNPGMFDNILQNKAALNVQIIYTEISRKKNGTVELTDHYFNKENTRYFYPASAIKLPLALLALQKINELSVKGITATSTMIIQSSYSGQTEVYNDPNTPDGRPNILQYIKRAMLVNDNDACNRLYEFLGSEYINTELKKKGYAGAEILHRVGISLSDDENRHTNAVSFYDAANRLVYTQPAQYSRRVNEKRNDVSGKGYMAGGKLINKPMDMSGKNKVSLQDLHTMITWLYFPEGVKKENAFNISESDRQFLTALAGQYPGESKYPYYSGDDYDGYTKYIFFGGDDLRNKTAVRSYNTSGIAYGQMTDAAYVKDSTKNIEYIVSATIYCNADEIINDDSYDYTTVGFPFLKNLGKALYDYEAKKKR